MIFYGIDYKKTTFVSYRHFSLSLFDAVAVFHNGFKGNIDTYMRPELRDEYYLQDNFYKTKYKNFILC